MKKNVTQKDAVHKYLLRRKTPVTTQEIYDHLDTKQLVSWWPLSPDPTASVRRVLQELGATRIDGSSPARYRLAAG